MSIGDIKEITVDISEENDIIRCSVELIPRGRHCAKKLRVETNDVVDFLNQKGYSILIPSGSTKRIYNYRPDAPTKGAWTFQRSLPLSVGSEKIIEDPDAPSPRKKRTYKKRTTKPKTAKE